MMKWQPRKKVSDSDVSIPINNMFSVDHKLAKGLVLRVRVLTSLHIAKLHRRPDGGLFNVTGSQVKGMKVIFFRDPFAIERKPRSDRTMVPSPLATCLC